MSRGFFVFLLLLALTASVGCNVYQYRQSASSGPVAAPQDTAYLKDIAGRMAIEVKSGARDCDIAADILCKLNETESAPSEVLSKDAVKDAAAFFNPEDSRKLKAMSEFFEKIRGKRVIVLPKE